ncbi:hypothetical protein BN2475_380018 [Paraburkholderia ribeironis]|uniref:Uncharacterized protein n=1 Tax=Paraburkholderia ribeironis TaxID=1247936 RepID=A0A1N7S5S2_9BURK|nr:hypothetical protein BN2475_380018 [Paraburkholderia ribeironis]
MSPGIWGSAGLQQMFHFTPFACGPVREAGHHSYNGGDFTMRAICKNTVGQWRVSRRSARCAAPCAGLQERSWATA